MRCGAWTASSTSTKRTDSLCRRPHSGAVRQRRTRPGSSGPVPSFPEQFRRRRVQLSFRLRTNGLEQLLPAWMRQGALDLPQHDLRHRNPFSSTTSAKSPVQSLRDISNPDHHCHVYLPRKHLLFMTAAGVDTDPGIADGGGVTRWQGRYPPHWTGCPWNRISYRGRPATLVSVLFFSSARPRIRARSAAARFGHPPGSWTRTPSAACRSK